MSQLQLERELFRKYGLMLAQEVYQIEGAFHQSRDNIQDSIKTAFSQINTVVSKFLDYVRSFQLECFCNVPDDIIIHIFSYLPHHEKGRLLPVCKKFYQIMERDHTFWKTNCMLFWLSWSRRQVYNIDLEWVQLESGKTWHWLGKCFSNNTREGKLAWTVRRSGVTNYISLGPISNSLLEGWGIRINSTANSLTAGDFKGGDIEGYGIQISSLGRYRGFFASNTYNGFGVATFPSGSIQSYEGDWESGNHHGYGTLTWRDGVQYVGRFMHGNFNGIGKLVYPDGYEYEGKWKLGQPLHGIELVILSFIC
jgi:hypothetical protein